jgi:hypothetical protein
MPLIAPPRSLDILAALSGAALEGDGGTLITRVATR